MRFPLLLQTGGGPNEANITPGNTSLTILDSRTQILTPTNTGCIVLIPKAEPRHVGDAWKFVNESDTYSYAIHEVDVGALVTVDPTGIVEVHNVNGAYSAFAGTGGNVGPEGPQGDQGEQGIQGIQGIQGPTGATGATGAAGATGATGATGAAGADGADGTAGPNWYGLYPTAGPYTDYFDDHVLSGWTEWDPGSKITITEGATRLRMRDSAANDAGNNWGGIQRLVPPYATYTITAAVYLATNAQDTERAGIVLFSDFADQATCNFVACNVFYLDNAGSPTSGVQLQSWDDYETVTGAAHVGATDLGQGIVFIRVFVNTTTNILIPLWSANGLSWIGGAPVAFSATSMGDNDPIRMGLAIDGGANITTNTPGTTAYFAMFRVDNTTDPYLPCGAFRP